MEDRYKREDIAIVCLCLVFTLIDMALVGGVVWLFLKMLMHMGII